MPHSSIRTRFKFDFRPGSPFKQHKNSAPWPTFDPQKSSNISFLLSNQGCILFAWIYGCFWATYPLFTANRFVLDGYLTTCTFDYTNQQFSTKILILLMFLGGFVIPLLLIIAFYTAIWHILRKNCTKSKLLNRADASSNSRFSSTSNVPDLTKVDKRAFCAVNIHEVNKGIAKNNSIIRMHSISNVLDVKSRDR